VWQTLCCCAAWEVGVRVTDREIRALVYKCAAATLEADASRDSEWLDSLGEEHRERVKAHAKRLARELRRREQRAMGDDQT